MTEQKKNEHRIVATQSNMCRTLYIVWIVKYYWLISNFILLLLFSKTSSQLITQLFSNSLLCLQWLTLCLRYHQKFLICASMCASACPVRNSNHGGTHGGTSLKRRHTWRHTWRHISEISGGNGGTKLIIGGTNYNIKLNLNGGKHNSQ